MGSLKDCSSVLQTLQVPGQNLSQELAKCQVRVCTEVGGQKPKEARKQIQNNSAVLSFLTQELNFWIKHHFTALITFISVISGVSLCFSPWGWKFLNLHSISGRVLNGSQSLWYVQLTSAKLNVTPADHAQMSTETCTFSTWSRLGTAFFLLPCVSEVFCFKYAEQKGY